MINAVHKIEQSRAAMKQTKKNVLILLSVILLSLT